jgi:two-component system phosphate regulon response regulator PhoB
MARILIVDDDKGATDLIEKIMLTKGYEPISVNESKKALGVATSVEPDLIILDLMMPEPTGFQLCRMLRAIPTFAATPIVIVTALDDSDSRIVAFGAGANDYITKPIHIDELTETIKTLLGETE